MVFVRQLRFAETAISAISAKNVPPAHFLNAETVLKKIICLYSYSSLEVFFGGWFYFEDILILPHQFSQTHVKKSCPGICYYRYRREADSIEGSNYGNAASD